MMLLSPDCQVGKHAACSGDAWSLALDAIVECDCNCHKEE